VTVLPDPPPTLPAEPRAFYEALRALLAALDPADLDRGAAEVDFGDSGVGVTLPHVREPAWTVAAQVSRRAAVVFAGPASAHFDERTPDWTRAAAAHVGEILRGEHEVEITHGPWRRRTTERVRIDFGVPPRRAATAEGPGRA